MKIIIAPNAFKESLTALKAAVAIDRGLKDVLPKAETLLVPMADGGEGTLACILSNTSDAHFVESLEVQGPLGDKIIAEYGIVLKDNPRDKPQDNRRDNRRIAVIESAKAVGLSLVPENKRDPLETSTYGCGELIIAALDKGCREFILGLGGSATSDAGMGALSALGVEFRDVSNKHLQPKGKNLEKIVSIDASKMDTRLQDAHFTLASDVDNLLLGLEGALMYAPQKGASKVAMEILQRGFENFSHRLHQKFDHFHEMPGMGAAGGLGAGLKAFLNADFINGADLMIEMTGISDKIIAADVLITGEGQLDAQSLHGKVPIALARLAKKHHLPVIAIVGAIQGNIEPLYREGIDAVFSLTSGPMTKAESIKMASDLLYQVANNLGRVLHLFFHKFSKD